MKTITMYELLGMVKDGKEPKKIKYNDKIYYYHKGYDFNYMYNSSDSSPMDRDKSLFTFNSYKIKYGRMCWDDNTMIDFLNDTVEVLEEEPRDIEVCGSLFTKSEYDKLVHCEEEKKIPEKIDIWYSLKGTVNEEDMKEMITIMFEELKDKYNQLIDYLKSKGE